LEALVDTGSTFTAVPGRILEGLGVRPVRREPFRLANGQFVESDVGDALVRLQGKETSTPVIFGEPGEEPLLGAVTLESLLLAVDPVHQVLVPVQGLRMRRFNR
jgi:clan AA aspartic protease